MDESPARLRPLCWIVYLPLALLPLLAAAVQAPRLERLLEREVKAGLAQAGQGWASVTASGRDVEIRGLAPDAAAVARAEAIARESFGVRRVDMHVGTAAP